MISLVFHKGCPREAELEENSLLNYFNLAFRKMQTTVFSGGFLVDMATEKHFILWLSALEAGS